MVRNSLQPILTHSTSLLILISVKFALFSSLYRLCPLDLFPLICEFMRQRDVVRSICPGIWSRYDKLRTRREIGLQNLQGAECYCRLLLCKGSHGQQKPLSTILPKSWQKPEPAGGNEPFSRGKNMTQKNRSSFFCKIRSLASFVILLSPF